MRKSYACSLAAVVGLLVACGSATGRDQSFSDPDCNADASTRCACDPSAPGCAAQTFVEAGVSPSESKVCGDGACGASETCVTCPRDCGVCAACAAAPSCTAAVGTPSSTTLRADLCVDESKSSALDAGTVQEPSTDGCGDPQLRLRLASVKTNAGGSTIYCIVNASDGLKSEVALTVKTKDLEDGETYYFDPAVGTLWGQTGLQPTTNNITLTYNCFRVKSDSWSKALSAGSDAATKVSGVAGPYGWAFGLGAVGAEVASAAIAASSGDELVFNAQQTIEKGKLLDLTNSRSWTIRKAHEGGFLEWSWDWELKIEAWGCADGTLPAPR